MKKFSYMMGVTLLAIIFLASCSSKKGHRGHSRPVKSGFCLSGETQIAMENGTNSEIRNVKTGDVVMSYNEKTGAMETATVLEMKQAKHNNMVKLNFENTEIKITDDHPVWVKEKGWASLNPAKTMSYLNLEKVNLLAYGDICFVLNADGKIIQSKLVKSEKIEGVYQTYTITKLSNNKRFFANGIVVGIEELAEMQ